MPPSDEIAATEAAAAPAAAVVLTPAIDKLRAQFHDLVDRRIATDPNTEKKNPLSRFGVTREMLGDYLAQEFDATPAQMATLTPETAKQILYDRVWRPLAAERLPEPVSAMLFDVACRRGVTFAGKLLQDSIGDASSIGEKVRLRLKRDGYIGDVTIGASQKVDAVSVAANIFARRSTLAARTGDLFSGRLGDGKIFGRSPLVALGEAALFAGRIALTKGL